MKNFKGKIIEKMLLKLKHFFTVDIKMKLLVGYLITNLMYLLIGSYFYFTKKIEGFNYKEYSIGLKYLFISNVIVFLVIIIKRKYQKNIVHIGIFLAALFRNCFKRICN